MEDCLLATAADALRVWDVSTGRRLQVLYAETPGAEFRLTFYDPASGQTNVTTLRDQTPLASAAFSPDGALAAAGAYDGTVRLWTLEGGQAAGTLAFSELQPAGENARVVQVVFSGDGSLIAGLTAGGEMDSNGRIRSPLASREPPLLPTSRTLMSRKRVSVLIQAVSMSSWPTDAVWKYKG